MRETVLLYLQQRNFPEIISVLRNNRVFNTLMDDEIFKLVFFQNFTNELFNQQELGLEYPAFLYQCHQSKDYLFTLNEVDEERVLRFLIDKTRDYNYASKLPSYNTSIEIIQQHEAKINEELEKGKRVAEKQRNFHIVEQYANNTESLVKSIFNSPQEKEFYLACKQVFPKSLILPNVSLTTLFNEDVVRQKFANYHDFYLKSSIDLVVVDEETYIPTLFFELDSKSFHSDEKAKVRDEIKSQLVAELGKSLVRITKKTGSEGIREYIDLLKVIKEENNIS